MTLLELKKLWSNQNQSNDYDDEENDEKEEYE